MGNHGWGPSPLVVVAVLLEGGAMGVAWLIGWGGHPMGAAFAGGLPEISWGVAATLPLFAFLMWSVRTRCRPIADLRDFVHREVSPRFAATGWGGLLAIALLAGVAEEALFRGALLRVMTPTLGVGGAVVVTSVLFGLAHLVTPLYALLAGLIGLYLASVTWATGSLLAPAVTHALYDLVALLYVTRTQSQDLAAAEDLPGPN